MSMDFDIPLTKPSAMAEISNLTDSQDSRKGSIADTDRDVQDQNDDQVEYHVYKRRWLGIACIALLNFCNSWGWLTYSASASVTAQFFNTSEAVINWLSLVIQLAYVAGAPLAWWMTVRTNIRAGLIVAAVLMSVGNWLRYAGTRTTNFGLTVFGQILIGFSQPFVLSCPMFYTDMWFTSKTRVSANAIASLANPLGGAIAQLVGPAIVVVPSDVRTLTLVVAAVSTACSFSVWLVQPYPKHPPCASAAIIKLDLRHSLRHLLYNPSFLYMWAIFSIMVGAFNAYSTFISQIMEPYGYSDDSAGVAGALLIFVGLAFSAVMSPLTDRFKTFLGAMRIQVPLICACYIGTIFMCTTSGQLAGPYVVSAGIGMFSFSLLPIFLEGSQELLSPADPMLSSCMFWSGGQLMGVVMILVMDRLKDAKGVGSPPGNMRKGLVFEAVLVCAVSCLLLLLRSVKFNRRYIVDYS